MTARVASSDTYRVGTGFDYTLTPRLGLTAGYDLAYLDVDGEPQAYTHTPRVGASYKLHQLFQSRSPGPVVSCQRWRHLGSPAVTATVTWLQRLGSVSAAMTARSALERFRWAERYAVLHR